MNPLNLRMFFDRHQVNGVIDFKFTDRSSEKTYLVYKSGSGFDIRVISPFRVCINKDGEALTLDSEITWQEISNSVNANQRTLDINCG